MKIALGSDHAGFHLKEDIKKYLQGIVICVSGIGISISANKVKGIRCALCSEPLSAKLSRNHNNCNMLAMGARLIGLDMAKEIVDTFVQSKFEGGRHIRRVEKIEEDL